MRKLKVPFLAFGGLIALLSIGSSSCKKTTTTVKNDTTIVKDSVYYSPWTMMSLTYDQTDSIYFQDITGSHLTSSVVSSYAILSYVAEYNGSDTAVFPAAEMGVYTAFYLISGTPTLEITDYDGSEYLYRYVLVPTNVLASSSFKGYTQQQLTTVSYTDLKKGLSAASATSTAK